ncbi:hypothetical protein DSM106972_016350 [Dulcicalothrix desertica PCC 7102]|uniref:Uncharacterized protein n=1 Tax=Dulcicalothrix desertica PCC 7102 TaxID=232991 RepID=A0A433VQU7_9CYAN|nr:hypothetical protein [Dulcicalothrix desertica]RUT08467.1 hypothetical protein DSM106972_016350 [Dulcicalothrix desertica PCC 7102]TWH40329.1 hypothetical protein CAL7102_09639 [Dulcicalothrix desertica PCC 7102]
MAQNLYYQHQQTLNIMKIQLSHFKGQFLFLLGLTIPAVLVANVNPVKAEVPSQVMKHNAPFIDINQRYDSLGGLQQVNPIKINGQDGGTGKEASDDKKKESKDGKESCESGNCGGIYRPGDERINPVIRGNIRNQLPGQLLKSKQPIF